MGPQTNRYPALWSLPRTSELKTNAPQLENMVLTIVFHNTGFGTHECMTVYKEIDSMMFEGFSVSN
jgi:hypothetical protein